MIDIRYKYPDKKKALSIVEASERDMMKFTLTIKLNEYSGSTIIRNIYEDFRMLGEALLVAQGIESKDHIEAINELLKLGVNTKRPLASIDNLRRIRNNINYRGYIPKFQEAEDAISLANACFIPLVKTVKQKIMDKK